MELWDLVSAFGRLMRETLALQPHQVVVDETPIQVYMEQIKERLKGSERLLFTELFVPPRTRGRLLGLFLAILELIKGRWIRIEQPVPFGEIYVTAAPSRSRRPKPRPAPWMFPEMPPSRHKTQKAHDRLVSFLVSWLGGS